jgi:AraC-like DNA-binding protein
MNSVAESLGVHPKKLQRLLKDEALSYKDILDEVRQLQALRFLEDTDMKINKISQLLDYTSDISFNTAFKRWYGMSPSHYRKR